MSFLNEDPALKLYYTFEADTVSGLKLASTESGKDLVYNANLLNGATVSTSDSKVGNASLELTSSAKEYVKSDRLSATGNNGITFAFWLKSKNSGQYSRVFDFGNGLNDLNLVIAIVNNNLWSVVINAQDSARNYLYTDENINDDKWRHFTWVINPDASFDIYLNGVLSSKISADKGRYPADAERRSNYLGKSNWDDPYLNGSVDDFRMYNRVLSSSEISTIYAYKGLQGKFNTYFFTLNLGIYHLVNTIRYTCCHKSLYVRIVNMTRYHVMNKMLNHIYNLEIVI